MLDENLDAFDIEDANDILKGLFNVREHVQNALTNLTQFAYLTDDKVDTACGEEDWIDLGILWRDLEKAFDDARKVAAKRKEIVAGLFGVSRGRKVAKDPTNSLSAQGRLGSARAEVKTTPILPRRGSPEHIAMQKTMGVDDWAIEEKLLSPNWSHVGEYLAACTVEGKKPPFDIKSENTMTAIFRKRNSR